jgi:cysteine-rich repeat protein
MDGTVPSDGSTPADATPPDGSTADAGPLDGAPATDGAVDGGPDAASLDAATSDAGPCGACTPTSECEIAMCTEMGCLRTPVVDGTSCTAVSGGICVGGACVMRGCGDGYREPGPTPAREGCDDGNTVAGDACDATCVPSVLVVASRPTGEDFPGGPAPSLGLADDGSVLFVWSSVVAGAVEDTLEVHARRYSAAGVAAPAMADPIVIDAGLDVGWNAEPTVAGRPGGGWVVVWSSPTVDGDLSGIAYRVVHPDGSLGPVMTANMEARFIQHQPRVASLLGSFVIVWTDESGLRTGDDLAGIRARRFMPDGTPLAAEAVVPTTTSGDEYAPALAARGDDWIVAWSSTPPPPMFARNLRARRFSGATPTDATDFAVSTSGEQVAVAALDTATFALTWVDRSTDAMGDVMARDVNATGSPSLTTPSPIASMSSHAELRPTVGPTAGASYVVGWQDGGVRRGAAFAHVSSTSLPMAESMALAGHLNGGLGGELAIIRGTRGIWFVWSDAGSLGDPAAYRSNVAYLLPVN